MQHASILIELLINKKKKTQTTTKKKKNHLNISLWHKGKLVRVPLGRCMTNSYIYGIFGRLPYPDQLTFHLYN